MRHEQQIEMLGVAVTDVGIPWLGVPVAQPVQQRAQYRRGNASCWKTHNRLILFNAKAYICSWLVLH
jgi:hypothetical protein